MTPHDIYRSALDFLDHQTADLPAEVRVRMMRSYLSILAEPDGESTWSGFYPPADERDGGHSER